VSRGNDNQRICDGTFVLVGPRLEVLHRVVGLVCPLEWLLFCWVLVSVVVLDVRWTFVGLSGTYA
jgi:hypothetical protein